MGCFQRIRVAMTSPEEGKEIATRQEDMEGYGGYTGDLFDWGTYLEDSERAELVDRETATGSALRGPHNPVGEERCEVDREMRGGDQSMRRN